MEVFRTAFRDGLVDEIAPGIVPVTVAPVFGFAVYGAGRAVGPGVLGRGQAVELVIRERLCPVRVFVVGDRHYVAVVLRAVIIRLVQVETANLSVVGIKAGNLQSLVQVRAQINVGTPGLVLRSAWPIRGIADVLSAVGIKRAERMGSRIIGIIDDPAARIRERF